MMLGNTSTLYLLSLGFAVVCAPGCSSGGDSRDDGTNAGSGGAGIVPTGGSGGSGIVPTNDGGGPAGGSGLTADAACFATQVQGTQPIPTDIFIMQDKSASMNCPAMDNACEAPTGMRILPTRWTAFSDAMNTFVNSSMSAGLGVGIGFFPLTLPASTTTDCNMNRYAVPAQPIAPLPGNAASISEAIGSTTPNGGTPTVPALQGAIAYAKAYMTKAAGRGAAIVLVSDGLPTGCLETNNTVPGATMLVQQAFTGSPSIRTFVVGLGNTSALDQIALAGSGGMTHYFPATGDVAGKLVSALKTITGIVNCDYAIPMSGNVDPSLVNVQVKVGTNGATTEIGYVSSAAECGSRGGWYYDNPTRPTRIVLCTQSCGPLKTTDGSSVQVLYGCRSRPPA